ncbi:MAG: pyridoxal-phosphate dependent enzyme [Vicinamibacterales bacterium]
MRAAAADADRHGWSVISDTSWDGYEEVPRLIMLGYTHMVAEMAADRSAGWRPDAIVVPGGVGGLLGAVAQAARRHWAEPPRIVAVEPTSAACLQASARAGRPTPVPGPFDTAMGGLRCGEVSPLAFEAVRPAVDAYVAIDEEWMEQAMRALARPQPPDPSLAVGACGAAALGALFALTADADPEVRQALGLGSADSVVLIATEGVTDPAVWARVVEQG